MAWRVYFFEDDDGRQPVKEWLTSLGSSKRAAAIAAIEILLAEQGQDVCGGEHGKHLGDGLFEFRVRHEASIIRGEGKGKRGNSVLLRIFCHAHGDRLILLLGGYDKGASPSAKKQQREIAKARKRLRTFKLRAKRKKAAKRRRQG